METTETVDRVAFWATRVDELQDKLDKCYDKFTYFQWCDALDELRDAKKEMGS